LPGITGPKLYETPDGKRWVVKTGKSEDHLRNEVDADNAYRAMNVPTPNSGLSHMDGKLVKYSEFLEDTQTLNDWKKGKSASEIDAMHQQLGKRFVADAVLANWDVVGLANDNILIKNGTAYRVDNGGALKYRAQGGPKGEKFGSHVGELETLKDHSMNPTSAKVFGHVSSAMIKEQIIELSSKKENILNAISDLVTRKTVENRIYSLIHKAHLDEIKQEHSPVDPIKQEHTTVGSHILSGKSSKVVGKAHGDDSLSGKLTSVSVLVKHLKENEGDAAFGAKYLQKIAALNPNGVQNGKILVPYTFAGKEKDDIELQQLKSILPHGTTIHKVALSEAELKNAKVTAGTTPHKTPIHQGSDISVSVNDIKNNPNQKVWENSLTSSERSVIGSWKGSAAGYRKAIISDPPPPPKDPKNAKAAVLYTALIKAPQVHGVVWRGVHNGGSKESYADDLAKIIKTIGEGGIWEEPAPHCTSRNKTTGKDFSHGKVLMKLRLKTGRLIENIGSHVGEQEVVGMPAKYRILKIGTPKEAKDLGVEHYFELEEI